ncbi:FecCD family ABC transporter permease [Longispora albida]|uniref:FecCD family ABC transporter permease n=1 Tax=Longispora albida TaxID=203523 RepID=UPI00036CA4F6|nr:iron chelate uptake ABC transporter family permease subunit [Longispora albida]
MTAVLTKRRNANRRAVTGWPVRLGPVALLLKPRTVLAGFVLLAGIAAVTVTALGTGEVDLTLDEIVAVLTGDGEPGPQFIIETLRLPRALTALTVGAALGASGALLQGMARNPLVSPDIIGFTSGSATGAIVSFILGADSLMQVGAGALAGGTAASLLVYLLAYRRGGTGPRLVLVGVGATAALTAFNSYLISKAPIHDAMAAQSWLVGGLNNRGWDHVTVMAAALAVLMPLVAVAAFRLRALELGDTTAQVLGARAEASRLLLLCTSVGLAAMATAIAGPVAFVAFAAPHLTRPLTGGRPGPFAAAGMGALLLAGCDVATQRLFSPVPLPVGILTAGLGGCYLAWMLATSRRSHR